MAIPPVLLLDLDGTLVDANDAIIEGVLELAAACGLTVPEESWLRGRIGHDPRDTWELLGADDPDAMVTRFTATVLPRLPARTVVLPGVELALAALREAGHVLAVATARLTFDAHRTLDSTGLSDRVDHVTGRDLVERGKPHPDILLHALAAVGATPEQAIMIGDSDADVIAARAAGVPCWGVLGGAGTEKSLQDAGAARILAGGIGDAPALLSASHAPRR